MVCVWNLKFNLLVSLSLSLVKFIWIVKQIWHTLSFVTVLLQMFTKFLTSFFGFVFYICNNYVSQFGISATAASAQHNLFPLFSYCVYIFSSTTRRSSKKIQHHWHLFAQQSTHTHTQHFSHFLEMTKICKCIAEKKNTKIIIIVVTNEQS